MTDARVTVPDDWIEDAEEMDVSTTEFVLRMAHAGRRKFGYDRDDDDEMKTLKNNDPSNTGVAKEFVQRNLSVEDPESKEDLMGLIQDDIAEALDELSQEGSVDYLAREGGWIKVEDND